MTKPRYVEQPILDRIKVMAKLGYSVREIHDETGISMMRVRGYRQSVLRDWHHGTCADCGASCFQYGRVCRACYVERARVKREALDARVFPCRICGNPITAILANAQKTCDSEWCQRLYAFYYVEGRSLPSSARGGETNALRFDFLLSDYIRRVAHAKVGT